MLEVDLLPSEIEQRAHTSAGRNRENDEQPDVRGADMLQQCINLFARQVAVARGASCWQPDAVVTATVTQI